MYLLLPVHNSALRLVKEHAFYSANMVDAMCAKDIQVSAKMQRLTFEVDH